MRRHRSVLIAALAVVAAACNGTAGSLAAGEVCHSSSECAAGLACDFNASPAVCAGNLTPIPDAAIVPDAPPGTPDAAPPPDAALIPDAAAPPDAALPPDAAPVPPDAADLPDAT